jgi:putative intracellular protease/amidase
MNIEFFKRYSAIICGGGEVGEFLSSPRNRANLERILTALNRENKLIASIGTGQAILAKSGHLEGKDVAKVSVPQASEKFELNEKKYPRLNWSDQKVVRSGNVVTASGQEAAKEFADEIVRLLQENR